MDIKVTYIFFIKCNLFNIQMSNTIKMYENNVNFD